MTADDRRAALAEALPHTMGCVAHRSAGPSPCICFHDKTLDRLLPVVDRLCREAAAKALRDAADGYATAGQREWAVPCTHLRAKAVALATPDASGPEP